MENASDINSDKEMSDNNEGLPILLVWFNYFTAICALVIFIADIFAIYVMSRCTRIPVQVRKLSTSYILSDAIGALFFFSYQVVILGFNMVSELVLNLRVVCVGMMLSVSWFSIAALASDRAIALQANLRYATLVRRSTINITIFVIWTFHFIAIPLIMIVGFSEVCGLQFDVLCDVWAVTKTVRFFKMILLVIVGITVVGSNAYVHRIARRHERQIADIKNSALNGKRVSPDKLISERQFSITKAVLTITLAFVLLNLPIIIHLIILETNVEARHDLPRRAFHAISYMCIQINSFINLSLYAGKFKEFKFHTYIWLGNLLKKFAYKADELRVDVYNIVVSNDHLSKTDI